MVTSHLFVLMNWWWKICWTPTGHKWPLTLLFCTPLHCWIKHQVRKHLPSIAFWSLFWNSVEKLQLTLSDNKHQNLYECSSTFDMIYFGQLEPSVALMTQMLKCWITGNTASLYLVSTFRAYMLCVLTVREWGKPPDDDLSETNKPKVNPHRIVQKRPEKRNSFLIYKSVWTILFCSRKWSHPFHHL